MADQEFPGAAAPAPELHALEARVQWLELELAALRREVAGRVPASEELARTETSSPAQPPPPPAHHSSAVLRSAAATSAASRTRLVSEQWTARRGGALPSEQPRESLESRLGSQYFNRIAIVLLLIGTAYGMKLAVDRGLIGAGPRVVLGLLAGAALVLWSERFRRKGFAAFSYSLKALGSGVLYLALWAAFRLYELVPGWVALGAMVLVTAWNAYMAWAQNAELLAVYALAGGFATPMLLSTGGNHEIFLFTYLLAMDVATVVLVRLRRWPRLLLGAFPLSTLYFAGWYWQHFAPAAFAVTCAYIGFFAAVFGSVPLWPVAAPVGEDSTRSSPRARKTRILEEILLPGLNAVFVALAYSEVLQNSGRHGWLPWLMVLLAAVYLAAMRLPQSALVSSIHLAIAVVLLTIAVPLKASGHWITVSWLAEGLALTWVATRLTDGNQAMDYAAKTLRWMATAALLLGFCGVVFHVADEGMEAPLPFLNQSTGTAMAGIGAFACAAWFALRASSVRGETGGEHWTPMIRTAVLLIPVTALLLSFGELRSWGGAHAPFQTAEFFTALLALGVFAGVIVLAARSSVAHPQELFWKNYGALASILFNLIAVLTGVREVSAMWAPAADAWTADAALQQALAISGFLMLYGATLLALGFWRRSGFLRWQALALLVFTILKAFVYDMRNLSQGYRVVSLMGLGALLLAVSFAYQKDWLDLKGAAGGSGEQDVQ